MLKHDSAHPPGACYINLSKFLTRGTQQVCLLLAMLSLLPFTIQKTKVTYDENRFGDMAYGQSSRNSKLTAV